MPFGNTYPIITLDSRHVNKVEVSPVILSQGDSNGRIIRYALWDGQDAMSGTGLSARFCIDQDEGLYAAMTAVAGASTATFQVAVPMGGIESGWHVGCIRVTDSGGRVINTRTFRVYVEKAVVGGSAEQITAYADIIAGAENATSAANTAATAANNAAASAIAASGNRLTATLDGTGATHDTASDAWTGPLIGATVDGLSVQDGMPTPSAPVAIKSVEGAGAVVAGKNLFNHDDAVSSSGTYKTWTDTGFALKTTSDNTYRGLLFDRTNAVLKPGITYTVSADVTIVSGKAKIASRRIAGNQIISSTSTLSASGHLSLTFTQSASEPMYITFFCTYSTSEAGDVTYNNVQVEIAASESSYELPSVTTTALLPSTAAPLRSLPDGTHDELSVARDGTVSVIRRVGHVTLDGSENWTHPAGTSSVYTNSHTMAKLRDYTGAIVSNKLRTAEFHNSQDQMISQTNVISGYRDTLTPSYPGENWLYVRIDNDVLTAAAAKAWFQSNPTEVIYKLATPTTETLPSVTMPTVPSRNLTAWVDATDGDGAAIAAPWEMTYERDVTYVIEQLEQAIADI